MHYVVDATGLLYRAFHGIPLMRCASGLYTNAVFGYTAHLLALMEKIDLQKQGSILAVFDPDGPSFREGLLPSYKADRERPANLNEQFEWAHRVTEVLGIPKVQVDGFEADDVIASVVKHSDLNGEPVAIVTVDKDMLQLVNGEVQCYDPFNNDYKGIPSCLRKFGVIPALVPDAQALIGDASDGIPGVKGVGVVGASGVINKWGDLENLLRAIDAGRETGSVARKIADYDPEELLVYRQLARLVDTVPVDDQVAAMRQYTNAPDMPEVRDVFGEIEFNRHLATLEKRYGC